MLDFIALAMLAVVFVLGLSIYLVRAKKNKRLHRTIQIATAVTLTIALIAFEIDVRFITKWRELAEAAPFYQAGWVDRCLAIHLVFAIPTPLVWGAVIFMALRGFKSDLSSEMAVTNFNRFHRISGRTAAVLMLMTAITGWIFYYVAFVA